MLYITGSISDVELTRASGLLEVLPVLQSWRTEVLL